MSMPERPDRDWNSEFAEVVGQLRLANVRPPRERTAEEHAERLRRNADLERRLAEEIRCERRAAQGLQRRRARYTLRRWASILAIIAIAGALAWEVRSTFSDAADRPHWVDGPVVAVPPDIARGLQRPPSWPSTAASRELGRLAPEPVPPPGEGGFAFLQMQPTDPAAPVTYDPCVAIPYVVRLLPGTEAYLPVIEEAVATVGMATGLRFVFEGQVDEAPSLNRPLVQRDRYGDRWSPVLIAFSDPAETEMLEGDVVGTGGSAAVGWEDTSTVYVTGQVTIDTPFLRDAAIRYVDVRPHLRAILLHELAHVVGLDHMADPTSIMTESASHIHDFGDGDLRGLARLGSGPCVPEI